jgi:hypothetical protein
MGRKAAGLHRCDLIVRFKKHCRKSTQLASQLHASCNAASECGSYLIKTVILNATFFKNMTIPPSIQHITND